MQTVMIPTRNRRFAGRTVDLYVNGVRSTVPIGAEAAVSDEAYSALVGANAEMVVVPPLPVVDVPPLPAPSAVSIGVTLPGVGVTVRL